MSGAIGLRVSKGLSFWFKVVGSIFLFEVRFVQRFFVGLVRGLGFVSLEGWVPRVDIIVPLCCAVESFGLFRREFKICH